MARPSTPKLSLASQEFLTHRAKKGNGSPDVVKGYRSLLGRLTRYLNDIHVGSVQPRHLEDFFYGPAGLSDGCGKSTLGKYRGNLKVFLDWCHRRGYTAHTGMYLLDGVNERSTVANRDRFRMDRRQLLALMDAATDPRDRALIAFIANTGVRVGEALTMKLRDVRLARGEVYVIRHKTGEEVTYAVTSDLETELRIWLAIYTASLANAGTQLAPSHYLFPARPRAAFVKGQHRQVHQPEGWKPDGKILSRPRDIIRPIADRAGIELEPGDGWHTVRRSVARIFFDDAADEGHDAALRLTQALLGHKQSGTTEGYLGLNLEKRKVDSILRGNSFLTKGVSDGNVIQLDTRRAI